MIPCNIHHKYISLKNTLIPNILGTKEMGNLTWAKHTLMLVIISM